MKYSEFEIERRWLVLADKLPDLSKLPKKLLTDLYISNSRMRLRKEESDNGVKYKLCKKYGKTSEISEPITNIYLSKDEYDLFSALVGFEIIRERFYYEHTGILMSINVSAKIPTILEAEFISEQQAEAFEPPEFADKEVSSDERFELSFFARNHISFSIGSILGIFAAWKRGSRYDTFITPGMLVIQAVPQVVIAMLAMFIFAIGLKWFPTGYAYTAGTMPDWTSWEFIKDVAYHAVLPLVCASVVQIGGFLVNMRNNMINLLAEDYITMAKGKGLSENRVVFNYAARNALLPSVTALSMSLGMAIGGQLIIEIIFNYPGLGTVLFNAITSRDYQVLQGQLLIMTLFMLFFNLLADMLYVVLDPRLRKGGK